MRVLSKTYLPNLQMLRVGKIVLIVSYQLYRWKGPDHDAGYEAG